MSLWWVGLASHPPNSTGPSEPMTDPTHASNNDTGRAMDPGQVTGVAAPTRKAARRCHRVGREASTRCGRIMASRRARHVAGGPGAGRGLRASARVERGEELVPAASYFQ